MPSKPPPCEWQRVDLHALTYARLYPSGWWCARHTPNRQAGRPEPPPGPGWPIHRQPPHGTDPDTSTEHEEPTP